MSSRKLSLFPNNVYTPKDGGARTSPTSRNSKTNGVVPHTSTEQSWTIPPTPNSKSYKINMEMPSSMPNNNIGQIS
jgi:hypothetical protein